MSKIEKLELRHLAGYLPYKVECDKGLIVGCILEDAIWIEGRPRSIEFIGDISPFLRPLSDLTKEIEHNGERFVPKDSLHIEDFDYFDENAHSICLIEGFGFDLELLPFGLVQKLYEWNFDIHGLIKAGLAVDINTVKA